MLHFLEILKSIKKPKSKDYSEECPYFVEVDYDSTIYRMDDNNSVVPDIQYICSNTKDENGERNKCSTI